jgi:hypothetical protein
MPEIIERQSLRDQVNCLEQECRMILPGIQALFGFQLVAVFNNRFAEALSENQQLFHWAAIAFTILSTILILSPAAFHRQAEPHIISSKLVGLANRWVTLSLIPLMAGICTDFYLIGIVITKNEILSAGCAAPVFLGFIFMWFIFPVLSRREK